MTIIKCKIINFELVKFKSTTQKDNFIRLRMTRIDTICAIAASSYIRR